MDKNFDRALEHVLRHEGGFVNHPKDPGGATNKGITLATFRRYVKPGGSVEDLKKLTREQAATCYRRQYWDTISGSELPGGVDYAVFDFAVNSGPSRAAKYVQRVVGVAEDGKIGPATVAAIKARPRAIIINDLCDKRLAFLRALKTWGTFGKGWSSRVSSVRAEAHKIASLPDAPAPRLVEVPVEVKVDKPVPVKVGDLEKPFYKSPAFVERAVTGGALTTVGSFFSGLETDKILVLAGIAAAGLIVWYFIRERAKARQDMKAAKIEAGG